MAGCGLLYRDLASWSCLVHAGTAVLDAPSAEHLKSHLDAPQTGILSAEDDCCSENQSGKGDRPDYDRIFRSQCVNFRVLVFFHTGQLRILVFFHTGQLRILVFFHAGQLRGLGVNFRVLVFFHAG